MRIFVNTCTSVIWNVHVWLLSVWKLRITVIECAIQSGTILTVTFSSGASLDSKTYFQGPVEFLMALPGFNLSLVTSQSKYDHQIMMIMNFWHKGKCVATLLIAWRPNFMPSSTALHEKPRENTASSKYTCTLYCIFVISDY